MLKYYFALFLLLGLFIMSCSSSVPEPSLQQVQWASARWPGTDIRELSEGRDMYIEKCSGCHSLKIPSNYTEEEWTPVFKKMDKKAKLSEDEREKIWHYISAMSKR
ncbi:MAG: c-type cytochrome [Syntrophomonadaceae bacterium]